MKKSKQKSLLLYIFIATLLVAGCQKYGSIPQPASTTTATQELAWMPTLAMQTEFTQLQTPTATFVFFPTKTPSLTPAPPMPTAPLPPLTPATPLPLENIHLGDETIYYDGFIEGGAINLSDYRFEKPFEVEARSYELAGWSADKKYLAEKRSLHPIRDIIYNHMDLGICILNIEQREKYLEENTKNNVKCIRLYTNLYDHLSLTHGDYVEIKNISWSPDNKYLLVTVKGLNTAQYIITSPCLIEIETGSVDCRWSNVFMQYHYDAYKIVSGAHAISWSPQDENKLAIPLKKNWYPIAEGVENGYDRLTILPWDLPTDDLKQGLYLVDITPSLLLAYKTDDQVPTPLWEAPEGTTIDHEQLPLWTSDGKSIAFVYIDPWFNIERSILSSVKPIANYALGIVEEDGRNFRKLFDSRSMYLSGILPPDSSLPIINIHRWVNQDRFLLFTAQINRGVVGKHEHSLFLYDTETTDFFQLTTWSKLNPVKSYRAIYRRNVP